MKLPHQKPASSSSIAHAAGWSLALAAASLAGLMVSPAVRAANVGVSVSISQPGVYGRIDIGRFPQPEVYAPQPVIIQQPRVVVAQPVQPVYLWVPPGHQRHWARHCYRYNACGVPVYFVKEDWYRAHVAPPPPHYRPGPPPGRPPVYNEPRGRGHEHD